MLRERRWSLLLDSVEPAWYMSWATFISRQGGSNLEHSKYQLLVVTMFDPVFWVM